MNNAVRWFEIPVKDLARAKAFYEAILKIDLQDFKLNDNLQMAIFPADPQGVGGALCYSKDFYQPGPEGPLVYLNAEPDLENVLERVRHKKAKVIVPKTMVSKEIGFMAVIEDSEGNRVGLMSHQ